MSHFVAYVMGDDVEGQMHPYYEELKVEFVDKTKEVEFKWADEFREGNTTDDLATFAKDQFGYVKRQLGTTYQYGYWHNPQAKWDWWVVGGRWEDRLVTHDGRVGDSFRKGEISLKKMAEEGKRYFHEECEMLYDYIHSYPKEVKSFQTFEELRNEHLAETSIETIRTMYWDQPLFQRLKKFSNTSVMLKVDDSLVRKSKELLIAEWKNVFVLPFAFVYKGQWVERARMGWWAITHDENDQFEEQFFEQWESLPDDVLVTVVDCHI